MKTYVVVLAVVLGACARHVPPAFGPDPADTASLQHGPRYTRMEDLIQAKLPGVEVHRDAAGGISLRVRGASSLNASTEPLIIIDGVPAAGTNTSMSLAVLNPADVESIELVKDAAAEAQYGVRGSNGVIIIKTRKK